MFYRVHTNVTFKNIKLYYENKITKNVIEKTFSGLTCYDFGDFVIADDEMVAKMQIRTKFLLLMHDEPYYTLRTLCDVFGWEAVCPKWYQELVDVDYNAQTDIEIDYHIAECSMNEVFSYFPFTETMKELKKQGIPICLENKE